MIVTIERNEARLVGFSLGQSFLVGIPRVFGVVTADTLFLKYFTPAHFPYAYALGAIIVALFGLLYVLVERKLGVIRSVFATLLLMAVAVTALRVSLSIEGLAAISAFALLLWAEAEFALTELSFWSVANHLFTVRQAKRLFGLISAGEHLPTILGGLAVPFLVAHFGVTNLLYLSIGAHLLAAFSLHWMHRHIAPPDSQTEDPDESTPTHLLSAFKDRYVWLISLLVCAGTIAGYGIDNAFVDQANAEFKNSEDLAGFIGHVFVIIGVINLLFQTFLSGPWIEKLGLRGTLLSTPFLVLLPCIAVVAFAQSPTTAGAIFYGVIIMRVVEQVTVNSIENPVYYTLFQPFAASLRTRVQNTIDTIVSQGAGLLAGGLLILLHQQAVFGAVGLAGFAAVAAAVWLVVAWGTGRLYVKRLGQSLQHHDLRSAHLDLHDPTSRRILERGLGAKEPVYILYCMDLLAQTDHPRWNRLLMDLLTHASEDVRLSAGRHLEQLADPAAIDAIHARLEIEPSARVKARLLNAAVSCDSERAFELAWTHTTDEQPIVRRGAITALLRHGGLEGALAAGPSLLDMGQSARPELRRAAAETIGDIGVSNFFRGLLPLLSDPILSVREAALVAAGRLNNPRLLPAVAACLPEQRLRTEAITTLGRAQEAAIPVLVEAFDAPEQRWGAKQAILRTLGRIGGPKAHEFLLTHLESKDRGLYRTAVSALRESGFQPGEAAREKIEQRIASEAHIHHEILVTLQSFRPLEQSELLLQALESELDDLTDTTLLLLGFVYDPKTMDSIRENLEGDARQGAIAVELFEETVDDAHAEALLPAIEAKTSPERLEALLEDLPKDDMPAHIRLVEFFAKDISWRTTWLAMCAIDVAGHCGVLQYIAPTPQIASGGGETAFGPLTTETAEQAHALTARVSLLRTLDVLQSIPPHLLATLAAELSELSYEAGDRVLKKGLPLSNTYFVKEGQVRIGSKNIRGPKSVIGDLAMLRSYTWPEDTIAMAPTRLVEVRTEDIDRMFRDHFESAWAVLEALCDRFRVQDSYAEPEDAPDPQPRSWTPKSSLLERALAVRTISLFSSLSDTALSQMAAVVGETFLDPQETLVQKGEWGTAMFLLIEGHLEIHDGPKVIASIQAPDIIGELSAIKPAPRTASIRAVEPSHVLSLERNVFYELLWDRSDVLDAMTELLASRLQKTS